MINNISIYRYTSYASLNNMNTILAYIDNQNNHCDAHIDRQTYQIYTSPHLLLCPDYTRRDLSSCVITGTNKLKLLIH